MQVRSVQHAVAFTVALAGAAGAFVLTTLLMDSLPDTGLVAATTLLAALAAAALGGPPRLARLREAGIPALAMAAAGGALAFWAAPLLALSQRATDAPSGAETLFFTTSVWGALAVAAAFAARRERPSWTAAAGALGALAGAGGLLASWEQPSSFSPFAKFPVAEAFMIVAGALFAVGALALVVSMRKLRAADAITVALAAAAGVGVLTALPQLSVTMEGLRASWTMVLYAAVMVASFASGWGRIAAERGTSAAAVPLLAAPVAVTALASVERATAVFGVSPFDWPAASAGIAVIMAGCVVAWMSPRTVERGPATDVHPSRAVLASTWIAVIGVVLATAALVRPALSAIAEGHAGAPFRATWTMTGAESAVGWLALAAAVFALSAARDTRTDAPGAPAVIAAVSALVCVAATLPLAATTLHTWNSFIPADVQQAYGTEYARLAVVGVFDPLRFAACLAAGAAAITLLVRAAVTRAMKAKGAA